MTAQQLKNRLDVGLTLTGRKNGVYTWKGTPLQWEAKRTMDAATNYLNSIRKWQEAVNKLLHG